MPPLPEPSVRAVVLDTDVASRSFKGCSRSGSPRNWPGGSPCSRSEFGCCTASGPGDKAVRLEAAD
jgi:hypothetical protein